MVMTAEERKVDLVDRLAAEARARVGNDDGDSAAQFIRRYFALVAPDDIIYSSFETLLGGALSLWELGAQRTPGLAKVRIFNPTGEHNGWSLEHTVVEIINDDMPFLVDLDVHRRLDDGVGRCGDGLCDVEALAFRVAGDAHDRVHEEVDLPLAPVDLRRHGVDEEGHVVVDDFDDGVLERPVVLLGGGIENADLGRARRALRAQLPER